LAGSVKSSVKTSPPEPFKKSFDTSPNTFFLKTSHNAPTSARVLR
jgi:hypothetical protein